MPKVIMICGKICSGKTTYANKIKSTNHAVILSVDEIMLALFGQNVDGEYVSKVKSYLYKKSLGIEDVEGAFASQVFIGSPAQKGGIQAGDYIIELNGNKVKSVDQLVRDVAVLKAGEKSKFKLIRGGKTIEVTVTVEKRKEDISSDDSKLWPGFVALPLTDEVRKQLKVDDDVKGVAITNVMPKTPAAALRLQNGDVITAVNGTKVTTLSEFYNAMDLTKNKSIQFDVWNEAGTITTGSWKIK